MCSEQRLRQRYLSEERCVRHADSDGISDSSAFLCAYISPDEESDCGAECGADEQADGSTDGHTDGRTECGSERCADSCAYRCADSCTDRRAYFCADTPPLR